MKTNIIYKKDFIKKDWVLIDAKDMVLGRLSSRVAMMLKGKHKATYAPCMDCGDNVIIINARNIHLSGKKLNKKNGKVYYKHTGHPGGIKQLKAIEILEGKYPERVLFMSIERMLKKTALRKKIMGNLHIYPDDTHPHQAQKPKLIDLAQQNDKNKKRYNTQ